MIKLNVVKILDYYDYPQIFLSKDIFDSNFICVIGDVQDNYLYYIGVKITVQELKDLYKNTIDISALFTNEPAKSFINFKLNQDSDEDISANETTLAEISDFIPDEGLYIEDIADNCYLSDLAIDKNKTIFELHIEEVIGEDFVSSDSLIDFLSLTKKVFEYGFINISKNLKGKAKTRIHDNDSSHINVFALQTGSLKVNFFTNSYVDMMGISDDILLINLLKEIFVKDLDDTEGITEILRLNKGHLVSNIDKLCEKIIHSNIKYELNFALPNKPTSETITITTSRALSYHDIISKKNELNNDEISVTGVFEAVDLKSLSWKFVDQQNNEYAGKANINLLSGITIHTIEYNIHCEELKTEDNISLKEAIEYILTSIEQE